MQFCIILIVYVILRSVLCQKRRSNGIASNCGSISRMNIGFTNCLLRYAFTNCSMAGAAVIGRDCCYITFSCSVLLNHRMTLTYTVTAPLRGRLGLGGGSERDVDGQLFCKLGVNVTN